MCFLCGIDNSAHPSPDVREIQARPLNSSFYQWICKNCWYPQSEHFNDPTNPIPNNNTRHGTFLALGDSVAARLVSMNATGTWQAKQEANYARNLVLANENLGFHNNGNIREMKIFRTYEFAKFDQYICKTTACGAIGDYGSTCPRVFDQNGLKTALGIDINGVYSGTEARHFMHLETRASQTHPLIHAHPQENHVLRSINLRDAADNHTSIEINVCLTGIQVRQMTDVRGDIDLTALNIHQLAQPPFQTTHINTIIPLVPVHT